MSTSTGSTAWSRPPPASRKAASPPASTPPKPRAKPSSTRSRSARSRSRLPEPRTLRPGPVFHPARLDPLARGDGPGGVLFRSRGVGAGGGLELPRFLLPPGERHVGGVGSGRPIGQVHLGTEKRPFRVVAEAHPDRSRRSGDRRV